MDLSKRYKINDLNHNHIHNQVCDGFISIKPVYQHTIIELSIKQWNRYESNSILVEDIMIDKSDKKFPWSNTIK